MRRRLLAVGLAIGLLVGTVGPARAQTAGGCPPTQPLAAVAFETLTIGTTAVGFTVATMGTAKAAKVTTETATIRYRDDGTAPTATVGHAVDGGAVLWVCGASLGRWQAVRTTATSATAQVTYYR